MSLCRWGLLGVVVAMAAAGLSVGGWRVLVGGLSPNYCTMTYMSPRYLPFPVPLSPYAKYSLVLYREGRRQSAPLVRPSL